MLLTRQVIQLAIERNQVTLQVQSWYTNEQIANNWHWKTNIIVNILFDLSSSDWDVMVVLYWLNISAIYIDRSLSLINVGECLWCAKEGYASVSKIFLEKMENLHEERKIASHQLSFRMWLNLNFSIEKSKNSGELKMTVRNDQDNTKCGTILDVIIRLS